jgi:large subunit GTPase 1
LKDYVNGKLLFANPPPEIEQKDFMQQTHENALLRAVGKKQGPVTRVGKGADTFVPSNMPAPTTVAADGSILPATGQGHSSRVIDQSFFDSASALSSRPYVKRGNAVGDEKEYSRSQLYPHQHSVANDGTVLSGRRARLASVLSNGGEVSSSKKHHKKPTRVKQRSGRGYD